MSNSQKQLYFYSPEGLALVKNASTGAAVLLRAAGQALAQCDNGQTRLYATDIQGSALRLSGPDSCALHYTAYGFSSNNSCAPVLHYAGQRKDLATGQYFLGDGYRCYNTVQRRFNAPDNLSPFGIGGINAYCYCDNDPVNKQDPSGHSSLRRANSLSGTKSVKSSLPMPRRRAESLSIVGESVLSKYLLTIGGLTPKDFAKHIVGVKGGKFSDLLGYQGRNTGAWIDELSARNSFIDNDLNPMQGAGASINRDVMLLINDMRINPAQDTTDLRYQAAQRLIDAQDVIQNLEQRARQDVDLRAHGKKAQTQDSWLYPKKVRNP